MKKQNNLDPKKAFLPLNDSSVKFSGINIAFSYATPNFQPEEMKVKMVPHIEKRRHHRQEAHKPVRVLPIVPSKSGNVFEVLDRPVEGRTIDISETGAGLKISTRGLQPQSLLKLFFETPEGDAFEVYAKIIWSERTRCGVRFVLSDQAVLKAVREIQGASMQNGSGPAGN